MNLFIQEAAERDILRQIEWYAEKGVPAIGLRFSDAVAESLKARHRDAPERCAEAHL